MKKLFILLFFLVFFLFTPNYSFAEIIHSFDVDIKAFKNGELSITEKINYDFEDAQRHGIFRDIPLYSTVGDLYRIIKIQNLSVLRDSQREKFTISSNARNLNIKIGDANKTITGSHIYEISYKVINGIGSNFDDHDEIYWNITGNDWDVIIKKASAKVETDFNVKENKIICFEGPLGSKDQSCTVDKSEVSSSKTLYPSYGLSVVYVYPVNTFPKSTLSKNPPQTLSEKILGVILSNYYLIFILLNIVLPIALLYWYQKNKNKKRFGVPAVNFDIPKDEKGKRLSPAIAGTIDTAKLERDDIVATIFDLAIRKYLKLEEKKTVKNLLPDSNEQKIIKLKNADSKLEGFEKILFERLFKEGDSVKISDLRLDFYKTFDQMEKDVFKELVLKKYYIKNPKVQKSLLLVLGVFSLFFFNIFLAATLFFLSSKLNGRTPLGDEVDFRIDGLKLFLKSMNRNYKWQAEKLYTVEQMIPYAMALGFIDKFMEQLKIMYPDYNPSWYSGGRGNFYVGYSAFYLAASSNMTTSAPSSSSGAGGGGFSGGGGGGGGGGSW